MSDETAAGRFVARIQFSHDCGSAIFIRRLRPHCLAASMTEREAAQGARRLGHGALGVSGTMVVTPSSVSFSRAISGSPWGVRRRRQLEWQFAVDLIAFDDSQLGVCGNVSTVALNSRCRRRALLSPTEARIT